MVKKFYFFLLFLQLFTSSKSYAFHQDFENREYTRPALITAGVVSATYLISENDEGTALFTGIYSIGAIYLMNEWYQNEKEFTDLIVPFSLLTLAVVNISLLRDDDDYSENDVFIYNLAGLGLIASYAIWEHAHKAAPHSTYTRVSPFQKNEYTGLLLTREF